MSTRAVYKTQMDDRECLIDALKDICGTSAVKIHDGETETVSARLRGKLASFRKNKDGTYDLITGDLSQKEMHEFFPITHNNITVYKLKQAYSKAKVLKAMKTLRGTVTNDAVDEAGTMQIRIRTISFE